MLWTLAPRRCSAASSEDVVALFTPSLTYFSSCQLTRAKPGAEPSVVWLRGDHDVATAKTLAHTIAEALALGEPAVVVDLSDVHFLSAATLRVFVAAQETLQAQSRALVLRVPSPFVRRIFEVTGLSGLLDRGSSENAIDTVMGALGSWVEVPTTGRVDWHDASVAVEPNVAEQVSESAHVERPMFMRIP
jgi:anti-sigma B factor antagonist